MKYKGNEKPSEELLESLKEVEDYKNGDIELDTYEDVKEMRISFTWWLKPLLQMSHFWLLMKWLFSWRKLKNEYHFGSRACLLPK